VLSSTSTLRGVVGVSLVIGVLGIALASGSDAREASGSSRFLQLRVTGRQQTVFDWGKQRCSDLDVPDLSARAFRDSRGRVDLVAAHYINRRFVGRSLDHLKHPCPVVLDSDFDPDPSAFDDKRWIASTWTPDGETVYALIHDEYQGQTHPGQCPSGEYSKCWWNTVTLAISTNGGRSYTAAGSRPLVASVPYKYVPDSGTFGVGWPTNIVHTGGYYYAIVYVKLEPVDRPASDRDCLIRTDNLADPSSWRAWSGGTSFTTSFVNPYTNDANPQEHLCQGVVPWDALGVLVPGSLTYSRLARQWILVGVRSDGFYYTLSPDLIHWSPLVLFYPGTAAWAYQCGRRDPVHYPSLIDPSSASRNFQTVGTHAYLYFTLFHPYRCQLGLERDLVRVPVTVRAA
jgi:hypothetical protein